MQNTIDKMTQVAHKLLDVIEAQLERSERPRPLDQPDNSFLVTSRRWIADLMALWHWCDRASCRRARQCRCEPGDCLTRYTSLVPPEVRVGVKTMLIGRSERLSFDALRDRAPKPVAAVEAWLTRPDNAARKRGTPLLSCPAPAGHPVHPDSSLITGSPPARG